MSESDYVQSGRSKPPPPLPVRVSRKSQLMAALRQRTRPIVIENQELAYPFARLLQARESGELEHFPLMLIHSLRVGRNWRILADKRREGANEFCARGPVSSAQPPFAAVL